MRWYLQMAWRDARQNKFKLLLFASSIILGVAALVSINSFSANLQDEVNQQSKELAGADLKISDKKVFNDSIMQIIDTLGQQRAHEIYFASMVAFLPSNSTRLVQVRALEGDFPYYGSFDTTPVGARSALNKTGQALVDNSLLIQFDSRVGDSVKVGSSTFEVAGGVAQVPGRSQISMTVAPPVYIPMKDLEASGLLQKGSRVTYIYYFKYDDPEKMEADLEIIEPILDEYGIDFDTAEEIRDDTVESFRDLNKYLKLIAFVALVIGSLGVGSSVHLYLKEKIESIAVLRCLGASRYKSFMIFLVQVSSLALIGSTIGGLLGMLLQYLLPSVLAEFVPFSITISPIWTALLEGILIGFLISLVFTLIPLMRVRNVSPLNVLRADNSGEKMGKDKLIWGLYGILVLLIFLITWLQINDVEEAFYFTAFLVFSFLVLTGLALVLMYLTRRFFPQSWHYVFRQGLANLYRPNNQTLVLLITIGLGTALMSTLFLVQDIMLERVAFSGKGDRPNMVLFDIQNRQKEEVVNFVRDFDLPVLQDVPIVTMRLASVNGRTKEEIKEDTTSNIRDWALDREYRVTYRDSLIASETLVEGEFTTPVRNRNDSIFISLEKDYAERLGLELGDQLTFNVQGVQMTTYLGSLREIDWRRVQTNFLVVFPTGVLEKAPQFHVLVTRVESDTVSALFQRELVADYPNISVIDLNLILDTLDQVLQQLAFVIRFMALFSIITGFIVLIGSLILSRYHRVQENALLRTIGARKKQIISINITEYAFLGIMASGSGVSLSILASFLLAVYNFDGKFLPSFLPILLTMLVITAVCVFLGVYNQRSILRNPPLEVLRKEA